MSVPARIYPSGHEYKCVVGKSKVHCTSNGASDDGVSSTSDEGKLRLMLKLEEKIKDLPITETITEFDLIKIYRAPSFIKDEWEEARSFFLVPTRSLPRELLLSVDELSLYKHMSSTGFVGKFGLDDVECPNTTEGTITIESPVNPEEKRASIISSEFKDYRSSLIYMETGVVDGANPSIGVSHLLIASTAPLILSSLSLASPTLSNLIFILRAQFDYSDRSVYNSLPIYECDSNGICQLASPTVVFASTITNMDEVIGAKL